MPKSPAEQLRRCWKCETGTMRCQLLVQHSVNGLDTGQSYDFVCDECGATVTTRSNTQLLSVVTTLPAAGLFGAALLLMPLQGVFDKVMRGSFRFDFGGILILCVMGLGLVVSVGTVWATFAFARNQMRLNKATVLRA